MTTPERMRASAWWPKQQVESGRYAGTAACAECHAGVVREQAKSQMFRTFGPAAQSDVLRQHARVYHSGEYAYRAALSPGGASMVVSDQHGEEKQFGLKWLIGSGDVGQSYLWQDGGGFKETRFNYFRSLDGPDGHDGLDAAPGRLSAAPTSFEMAEGRTVAPFEVRSCLSCHTTRYPAEGAVSDAGIVGGIQCEACHGPGEAHVQAAREHAAAVAAGKPLAAWDRRIFDAARLSPAAAVDSCGACHSTPADVRLMGAAGVQTVRFPAYRLEKSRCWGLKGDERLECSSCHDPHVPIVHEAAAYDFACKSCHTGAHAVAAGGGGRSPAVCPVAKEKCVSCHMPKYLLPEMHAKFTDHDIRIVKQDGSLFPD